MIFETEHIVKLIQYLPEFVAEYKEIKAITDVEDPENNLF